mmetsp:Transcript_63744/g.205431  ORF Transcript_63744/g.205431 Transcript_63744/m.205431 type:complete len:259 (+) Transcript_63744:659-1435(+)
MVVVVRRHLLMVVVLVVVVVTVVAVVVSVVLVAVVEVAVTVEVVVAVRVLEVVVVVRVLVVELVVTVEELVVRVVVVAVRVLVVRLLVVVAVVVVAVLAAVVEPLRSARSPLSPSAPADLPLELAPTAVQAVQTSCTAAVPEKTRLTPASRVGPAETMLSGNPEEPSKKRVTACRCSGPRRLKGSVGCNDSASAAAVKAMDLLSSATLASSALLWERQYLLNPRSGTESEPPRPTCCLGCTKRKVKAKASFAGSSLPS